MLVGAYSAAADWPAANAALGDGRLGAWRCFNSELPTPAAAAFNSTPAGVRAFYSCKAPKVNGVYDWAGVLNGTYDTQYANLIAALPPGTKFTVLHEPENDVDAATYLQLYQHLKPIFQRNAQPGVEIWTVGGHYWWTPAYSGNQYYVDDTEAASYAAAAQPGTLARAQLIVDDAAYYADASVDVVCYWWANQGGGAYDAYKITDDYGKTAWQVLAARR
jgi:hypothetical protein